MQKNFRNSDNRCNHYMAKGHRNYQRNNKRPIRVNPNRYINKAIEPEVDVPYEPTNSFADFGLSKQTLTTLSYLKYDKPSEIQDKCIPLSLEGHDIIGLANTGTGKTAAFLLPIIDKLAKTHKINSVLILSPTRELAEQSNAEFKSFSAGQKLYSALIVGGASIKRQIHQVERGVNVIIGTPGRVKDLMNRHILRLSSVDTFVLDEADRMCDMGFEHDIRDIEAEISKNRQTLCYSATMTKNVEAIVKEFMKDPVTVSAIKNETNDHIEQNVIYAENRDEKVQILLDILAKPELKKVLIFGETKFEVQKLADKIEKNGLSVTAIHGNKSQSQRERALDKFRDGTVDILVATDVAARGLDIPNISHVINFEPPRVYEDYIHRIGRTGRAGKTGTALTFIQKSSY